MLRLIWLAVLVLLGSVAAFSQSPPTRSVVTGTVQDQAGAAIAGARVELSGGNATKQSTTTDQSGGFHFNRLPPGKYQVTVTYEGFDAATVEVNVGSPSLAPLKVVLAIASL